MGAQSWIVGTTKLVHWLQLAFSLSKAGGLNCDRGRVFVPPLPQDASADWAGPRFGTGNSRAESSSSWPSTSA